MLETITLSAIANEVNRMKFQRLKSQGALTIEQLEGYIICIKDKIEELQTEVKSLEDALKWRIKFDDKATADNNDLTKSKKTVVKS